MKIKGSLPGGNLEVNSSNSLELIGLGSESDPLFTGIFAFVFPEATGDGGSLEINTSSLLVSNVAQIGTQTEGEGNSGDITIKATDSVTLTDDVSNINFPSTILSLVEPGGTGNGGNVLIETSELTISNNAQVGTVTSGQGNTGDTIIRASEFVEINKEIKIPDDPPNGLFAQVDSNEGDGGNLTVETEKLSLKGAGSRISASTFGNGNAGNITLKVKEFFVENGAELQAIAFYESGDAGNITIEASELVQIEGIFDQNNTDGILGEYGGIFASAIGGTGNGGNLDITTDKLVVQDFGTISVSNFQTLNSIPPGKGAAGS